MEAVSEEAVAEAARKEGIRLAGRALQEAPAYAKGLSAIGEQLKQGKLTVHVDNGSLGDQMGAFSKVVQNVVLALLLAGAMIGSAIAASSLSANPDQHTAYQWTLGAFFVSLAIALLLALVYLVGFVKERRRISRERWGPDRF